MMCMTLSPGHYTRAFTESLNYLQENSRPILADQRSQVQQVLLFAMIPVVAAFSFVVFVIYRSRREAYFKQKEAEMKLNILEVQMKALRAQINPHFIFNCLNSIHHYIHQKDAKQAGDYLVRFSQLIRHVLEHSTNRTICLRDDLEALRSYIELEQLRMDHAFDYAIHVDQSVNPDDVEVPPMIIQPFVENSIWHGLNRRGAGGKLTIHITKNGEQLECRVEDNGGGEEQKDDLDISKTIKKTSLGMALIRERLEVVNSLYHARADFTIEENKQDDRVLGRRLVLTLPVL
ncbi:MAG: histidine kinase [Cyclobacteriaceae bacterium]|nr:histidine kinase [Cyclobacteriaceae bacterium]